MTAPDLVSGARPPHESADPLPHPGTNTHPGTKTHPETSTAGATWALFCGVGLLMLGNGLQGSLIGIRSQSEGFSTTVTGMIMAAYFAGFLFGSRVVTKALVSVGHIRVFAALASITSTAILVYVLAVTPVTWGLMRFTVGFCMAGLYVVAESWINDLATNKTRGRLLAIYMIVTMGGMALGQLLLNTASPDGFELFVLASVLVSLSLVPMMLSASSVPPTRTPVAMALRDLAALVPTGLTVSFLVGMAHGALIGMGAVYATAAGLRPSQVAVFVGAPMVGGVVFQLPIGWASDHAPRRGVMFVVAAVAAAAATALLVVPPGSTLSYQLMFVIGGMSFPLYSLGIAYTNDWLEPEQVLGASAALVMMVGIGAVLGPLFVAGLIMALGINQYFVALIVTHATIAAYVGFRILTRDGVPMLEQGRYLPFPARASAMAANLLVRRRPRAR